MDRHEVVAELQYNSRSIHRIIDRYTRDFARQTSLRETWTSSERIRWATFSTCD
jgi:hypothetical protein